MCNIFGKWDLCGFADLPDILKLIGVIFSIIMLIDCLRRRPNEFANPFTNAGEYDRIIWALIIVLTYQWLFVGSIVYFFVVKKQKD